MAAVHAFDGKKAVVEKPIAAHAHPMTEDEATHRLGEALNHLHAVAATFEAGAYVDKESALTADDLNVILAKLEVVHGAEKRAPDL